MRTTLESAAKNESIGFQIPAPIGGWNTKDALATMPELDAIFLDNFFPYANGVMVRKGYSAFATTPLDIPLSDPHEIHALLSYSPPSGQKQLFAADADGIYDVTAGGYTGTISSAATSGDWQSVNISTAGGAFLWCCNGVDKARYWDGSTWTVLDGTSTPPLTGIPSEEVVNVSQHQFRLFLTRKDKLSFYYLPVNSIAGAASEFPCGVLFKRGGYVVATGSWTIDAGAGMDDHFCILTSEGEVAVYRGIDPSNAATWALVGVYFAGRPIGRRCLFNLGGDLMILTVQGILPLSRLLQSSVLKRNAFVSDKIDTFITQMADTYGTKFGWQAIVYPEAQMLLINIPLSAKLSWQCVMNTNTGAWCRFLDWNAMAWTYHNGGIYFAASSYVRKAWDGQKDGRGAITARVKTAFQYIGGRGRTKRITLLRPIFTATAPVVASLALDTDFRDTTFTKQSTNFNQLVSFWDQAIWDQSYWSGDLTVVQWRTVAHTPGRAFSFRMRLQVKDIAVTWSVTDYIASAGGLM